MADENVTNLEEELKTPEVANEAETTEEATPAPSDENTDAGEEETEQLEVEEIEVDGKKYEVPKELAPKIMMQADYTRKTQEVAELRKETEAERATWHKQAEIREQLFNEKADLLHMDRRLAAYRNTNWALWNSQDRDGAQAAQMEYVQLRDHRENLNGHIKGREAELASQVEQETVTKLNKAVEALNKPDPKTGWDGKFDDDRRSKIMQFGVSEGYSQELMASLDNPLMVKHLWEAYQYRELRKQQRTAPARTPAEPAAKVPTARASSPINANNASMEAYAAARRAGRIK